MADDEYIDIRVRLKDARKFLSDSKQVEGGVDRIGRGAARTDRTLRRASVGAGMFRRGLGTLAASAKYGALALGGFAAFGAKKSLDNFMEAQAVTADLRATIKSTGGVANVTVKQVNDLTDAMARKSGIDDEQLKNANKLLLTFTKVRNEQGKNNNIYSQASKITADLSVRFGKDLNTSAIMVGKALNDPVKGITALSRAGIQFDDQQKKQIKNWMEHGKRLRAQKLIMKELRTQVGGASEAYGKTLPGALGRAKVFFGDLSEEIGAKLAPFVVKTINFMIKFTKQLRSGTGQGGKFLDTVRQVSGEIRGFVNRAKPTFKVLEKLAKFLGPRLLKGGQQIIKHYREDVLPMFKGVFQDIQKTLVKWSEWASLFWKHHGKTTTGHIKAVFMPIVRIMTFPIRNALNGIRILLAIFRGDWSSAWKHIKKSFSMNWQQIKDIMKVGGKALELIGRATGKILKGLFQATWWAIKNGAKLGWDATKKIWNGIPGFISGLADKVGKAAKKIGNKMKEGLLDFMGDSSDFAKDMATKFSNHVIGLLNKAIPDKLAVPGMKDINLPNNPIPTIGGAQRGGVWGRTGVGLVGENGPELRVERRGTTVVPLNRSDMPERVALQLRDAIGAAGGSQTIVVPVSINGREIARAVARHEAFEGARA